MAKRIAGQSFDAVPRAQTRPERATPEEVLAAVAAAFGVDKNQIFARSHQGAFQAAAYLLRRVCNLPLKHVSAMSGVSISRISKIQSYIEESEQTGPMKMLLRTYKVKH